MSIHQGTMADFLQGAKTLIENAAGGADTTTALACGARHRNGNGEAQAGAHNRG
jgi:hypothetical protein